MDIKTLLKNSLLRLIQTQSFEQITVQTILDDSGISRSTFYRHFKDKYDLMNWYYSSHVEKIIQNVESGEWFDKIQLIAQFIYENRRYFQKVAKVQGDNSFWNFFYEYGYAFYRSVYLENTGFTELNTPAKIALEFNCAGNIHVIRQWLMSGCDVPVIDISHYIFQLIPEIFRQYLE